MYVDREEDAPAAIDPLELMEIARLDLMEWTETFLQQWLDSRADPDRREQVVQEFLVTWIQVSGTLGSAWRPGAIRDEVSCRRSGSDARKSEADPPTKTSRRGCSKVAMDRRRRLLINAGETATDAALAECAKEHGIRVFPKARGASALNIDGSGISDQEYSYALRAEFDVVVANAADGLPLFASSLTSQHTCQTQQSRRAML
jgi:hypothetical protein